MNDMGTNINSNEGVLLFQILQALQNNDIMIDLVNIEDNYLTASFSSKTVIDIFEEDILLGVVDNIKINNKKHITLYIGFDEDVENYSQKASLSAILGIFASSGNKDMMINIINKEPNISIINFDTTLYYIESLNHKLLDMLVDKIKINSDNSIQITVIEQPK